MFPRNDEYRDTGCLPSDISYLPSATSYCPLCDKKRSNKQLQHSTVTAATSDNYQTSCDFSTFAHFLILFQHGPSGRAWARASANRTVVKAVLKSFVDVSAQLA